MNSRDFAEIAFKMLGVFILVTVLIQMPVLVSSANSTFEPRLAYWFLGWVIEAAAGLALILFGGNLARRVIPDRGTLHLNISSVELKVVAFAVVGLVTLISGIKDTAVLAVPVLTKPAWDEANVVSYLWRTQAQLVVRATVEIVIGVLLLIRRDWIHNVWSILRGRERYEVG
jgi:hypothetical protein